MNQYKWSAKNLAFFPESWLSSYELAGWDLSDFIEVSDDVYMSFTDVPPHGKTLGVIDGMPGWVDIPPLTAEQQKAETDAEKAVRRNKADAEIEWRQDAVDTGIATEQETVSLNEWKKYRVLLMRVDTTKPVWPIPPDEQAS